MEITTYECYGLKKDGGYLRLQSNEFGPLGMPISTIRDGSRADAAWPQKHYPGARAQKLRITIEEIPETISPENT